MTEFSYFDKIRIESFFEDLPMGVSGSEYKYMKIDKARELCTRRKSTTKMGAIYPNAFSQDMRFDISFTSAKTITGWGASSPLTVGSQLFDKYCIHSLCLTQPSQTESQLIVTVSDVKLASGVSIFNMFTRSCLSVNIFAEGIYNSATGRLCMTGCRRPGLSIELQTDIRFVDCEICINFQFSPVNLMNGSGHVKGSIESTRHKSDPLHFEPLDLSSVSDQTHAAEEYISSMDV